MTYNEAMTNLSIIILSYNTRELTKKCLQSVDASIKNDDHHTYQICVLDNNSTDGSVNMLRSFKPHSENVSYTLIESAENLGFSRGNNHAARKASGEYVLFLNSDIEVVENAIPKFLNWFSKSDYKFAGARLLNPDGSVQKSAGRFYSLSVAAAALFLRADYWGFSRFAPTSDQQVDWVSGACLMTSATIFNKLQGFDENIFMYWEELDLQYRGYTKNCTTGYFPNAQFIHYEGGSSTSRQQPILRVYEGYIYFYKKHYPRLHLQFLRYMLKLKAIVSLVIGKVIGNNYLIETYTKAYEVAQMD